MATFKATVFSNRMRSDGTWSIQIRITHNKKVKYIPTGMYCSKNDMKKNFEIKTEEIIDILHDVIKKYRKKCNSLGDKLPLVDVDYICDMLSSSENTIDFIQFGRQYALKLIQSGRKGTGDNYNIALNSLIKYTKRDFLDINKITAQYLTEYMRFLAPDGDYSIRKVSLYLGIIRAIHNKAKEEHNNEEIGFVQIPLSPFARFKIPKTKPTLKRALTKEVILKIININPTETTTSRMILAKDLFVMSFCLIGMNSADFYSCDKLINGTIKYNREKTKTRRDDEALISIDIPDEIADLVTKYRDESNEKVFNFHNRYSTPGTFNAAINKGLKEIGKIVGVDNLQFYAARHSWATLALNKCKIDKYTVHTALNHIDESMKVTDLYIEKDFTIINDANRIVMDYLFNDEM